MTCMLLSIPLRVLFTDQVISSAVFSNEVFAVKNITEMWCKVEEPLNKKCVSGARKYTDGYFKVR